MSHLLSAGEVLGSTACVRALVAAAATAVMARRRAENFLHATVGTTRPLKGIAQSHPETFAGIVKVSTLVFSQ